jgi:tetratricopeptide (TPR) repeat protein
MSQSTSFGSDPMAWFKARQRQVLLVGGSVLAVGLIGGLLWWTQLNKEAAASDALEQARNAIDGSAPLGQSAGALQRIIESYSGTDAAEEAVVTLAQVRMVNGQNQLAATALEEYIRSGPRAKYVAPAHGLLAGAQEGLGKWADAAQNYVTASQAVDLDVLKAQYLVNAARCFQLAGDREKGLEQLRIVAKEYPKTPAASEAIVRLSEATKGVEPRAH